MILFKCNPLLNTNCGKVSCGTLCHETTHPEFAHLDERGNPIVTYVSEEELPVPVNNLLKHERNDIYGRNDTEE